jgi:hypothetical protein
MRKGKTIMSGARLRPDTFNLGMGRVQLSPELLVRLRKFVAARGQTQAAKILHMSPTTLDCLLGGGATRRIVEQIEARLTEAEE